MIMKKEQICEATNMREQITKVGDEISFNNENCRVIKISETMEPQEIVSPLFVKYIEVKLQVKESFV